jgi:hypothetical protein
MIDYLLTHRGLLWQAFAAFVLLFCAYRFGHFQGYWKGFFYARACRNCPRFRECPECGSIDSPIDARREVPVGGK